MRKQDLKLLGSLILWALVPSIYLLIRMNIVAIGGVDINILGQMEWFDLIDEIFVTTLTVPLYFLLKPNKTTKEKNGLAFVLSFGIYFVFTLVMDLHIGSIASYMNADFATQYLLMQSISLLIGFVSTFMILLFTLNDKYTTIYILLLCRVGLLTIFDAMFIPKYMDIGASYSEIITNTLIAIMALTIAISHKYIGKPIIDISFLKEWMKIGVFAGIQIFLDNWIYAIMICKMVNAVNESGNYWVANNFIWGWLLIPITCMVEIIKKNNVEKLTFKNSWIYAIGVIGLWIVSMPFWSWFLTNVMAVDASLILNILLPLVPFYLFYIGSAFIDGWFISKGKTIYNTINSFIINIIYYGIVYILFKQGVFEQSIGFIIGMFGFGMVVHMFVSIGLYVYHLKKYKIV